MSSNISYSTQIKLTAIPKASLYVDASSFGRISPYFTDNFLKSTDPSKFKFEFSINAKYEDYQNFLSICEGSCENKLDIDHIHNILIISDAFQCSQISKPFKQFIEENCTIDDIINFAIEDTTKTTMVLPNSLLEIIASNLNSIFSNEQQKQKISKFKPEVFVAILDCPECSYPPAIKLNDFIITNYLKNDPKSNKYILTIFRYLNLKILTPEQIILVNQFLTKNELTNLVDLSSEVNLVFKCVDNEKAISNIDDARKVYVETISKLPEEAVISQKYEKEKKELNAEKEKLEKENDQMKKEINDFNDKCKNITSLKKQIEDENKKKQQALKNIKDLNPNDMNDIQKLTNIKTQLQQQIADIQREKANLEQENSSKQEELNNLRASFDQVKQLSDEAKNAQAEYKFLTDFRPDGSQYQQFQKLLNKVNEIHKKKQEEGQQQQSLVQQGAGQTQTQSQPPIPDGMGYN